MRKSLKFLDPFFMKFPASNEEVKDAVKEWLNGLALEVYDEGIQKLVTRCDKCLNVGGDFVEK
jgi:hypothetical protein